MQNELEWVGVSVPNSRGIFRRACPWCSHTRKKKREKCLKVIVRKSSATMQCYHCKIEKDISA